MSPSMVDLDEKAYKIWRKWLEVHRGYPREDPLKFKSDLRNFSEIKGNKTERRREEKRRESSREREDGHFRVFLVDPRENIPSFWLVQ